MLQNAYLLAKIGADTAESEQHFAEILPIGRGGLPGGLRRPAGDQAVRTKKKGNARRPLSHVFPDVCADQVRQGNACLRWRLPYECHVCFIRW